MSASAAPRGSVEVDVLVVGAGVAGLSTALGLRAGGRTVAVVSAGGGSTGWAQGGVAAAYAGDDDPVDHARDTALAGAGLCEPRALDCLVEEGPQRLADLLGLGARFDRDADGRLDRTLEGGHGRRRVVHAGGDATGAEVLRTLVAATEAQAALRAGLTWWRETRVVGLVRGRSAADPGRAQVTGALLEGPAGATTMRARAVVLATGGIGAAYAVTTNPPGVTGEGAALALLAGAGLRDAEFVQFHPTALHLPGRDGQVPLVSEALRGEGAVLRDHGGAAFMAGRHPLADLAPRDVVARAVHAVATGSGREHAWLDATGVADVAERFPTIAASCAAAGLDPARDWLPVSPAAHFWCGGVATDRWGASDVPGLHAVGEVAATGVHGGNRLASNSLLEGLVFGRRTAARLALELPEPAVGELPDVVLDPDPDGSQAVRRSMSADVGVVRTAEGLGRAARVVAGRPRRDPVALVAGAVVAAARAREESRGAHFRADHPVASDRWRHPVAVRLDPDGVPRARLVTEAAAAVGRVA
ncbi:L-aspartate oxidase [Nocardioides scoriae]|uniref:L-aspartate oxidase n=1 Tax=Nocardioides scoriae TaxID=642780 RepID=A0A1H1U8I2_9ACTN|nr:FAD-binding protein [Nocardioides scoriae]SDS68159.1 L-aspartate oxidase [Nocardioides scoriae]